ncbi:hypothetical protein [Sphingomonas sp. DT-204]|uniref:hypothetical protein n=1 Tax=Sphingomonas sp. DT-204 TaxID=3396166 RepID=UPI003F1BF58D
MSIFHRSIACAALFTLAGCGGGSAGDSRAELTKVLSDWNDANPICARRPDNFPIELPAGGNDPRRAAFDALVKAKLLKVSQVGNAFQYDVNQGAENTIRPGSKRATAAERFLGGSDICYGKRRLTEIRQVVPATDMAGRKTSAVTFAWKLDPAPWAGDASVQAAFPEIARALDAGGGQSTVTLVATDRGWQPDTETAVR